MSNKWTSVSITYRGVKEELGRILAPFFVSLVWLFFCMFVEVVAGSGIGETGSRVLLTVAAAVAAAIINVGALGIEGTGSTGRVAVAAAVNVGALGIEGTGSKVLLTAAVAAAVVNVGALGIEGTGSKVLLTAAVAADVVNVRALGIKGTGPRVLLTVAVAATVA
jgi:hypothetical protein